MARGAGPRRDTPAARAFADQRSPLTTDPAKTRAWQDRSRQALPAESEKRKAQRPARADTRAVVLARALNRCEYASLIPEVPHCAGELEVDELRGGARRGEEWLDPDACRAACNSCHRWKTDHKVELLMRLAFYEGLTRRAA